MKENIVLERSAYLYGASLAFGIGALLNLSRLDLAICSGIFFAAFLWQARLLSRESA